MGEGCSPPWMVSEKHYVFMSYLEYIRHLTLTRAVIFLFIPNGDETHAPNVLLAEQSKDSRGPGRSPRVGQFPMAEIIHKLVAGWCSLAS